MELERRQTSRARDGRRDHREPPPRDGPRRPPLVFEVGTRHAPAIYSAGPGLSKVPFVADLRAMV
jgi:hypothetical protein